MADRGIVEIRKETALTAWVRVGLLVLFGILAGWMFSFHRTGHPIWQISENNSLAFFLFILFTAAAVFELVALAVFAGVRLRGGSAGEVTMLNSLVRVAALLAALVALLYYANVLSTIGAVVGAFAGMLLGWSLQAPVSGMAAWVLIVLKRPFRVGDRVLFPSLGLLGDVLEVGLMYTKLNQVGGSVGSEEASGRYILIPNAMLFSQVAINYTPQQTAPYFLDEVIIRLTYDSDWNVAEKILIDAAQKVTGDIIRKTGKEPYIRADIYDYGVLMRLRYMTLAVDRPRIAHEILKDIFGEFQRDKRVDFAIPYVYSYRKGVEVSARGTVGGEAVVNVTIESIDDPDEQTPLAPEDARNVENLAERIQQMGLLQPVVVQRMETGRYLLLVGRLRLLACKQLGWKDIPAIVKEVRGGWYASDAEGESRPGNGALPSDSPLRPRPDR